MAKILCDERVIEYSKEFKISIVELTLGLNVKAREISDILNLHPIMVYRWRQEYKEGKLKSKPTRKVSMMKQQAPKAKSKKKGTELDRVKAENARLKKEVDLLKKWQGYLAEQKQKDLGS